MSLYDSFSILGGIGLFLFGMSIMSTGLRDACGDNLQSILEKATSNKYVAVIIGLLMTMLIQSSSATDVMVIGFVNAGLMNLAQAVGVIMGANIGTTITAQITAFNLATYAPLILFIGAIMYMFIKKTMVKHIGAVIMGFGMLFLGISIMKAAIMPLSKSQGFINFISNLDNPALALIFGVGFTALLQSSSSSTVIFQTFAVQGLLDYNTAVYLVIGAAIGSVTPNILASLTTNRNGKRTALLNLSFNLVRTVILIFLINLFPGILTFIQNLSPDNVGRQIANTHTIFAILAVLIELPFTAYLIKLVESVIKVKPEESERLKERKLMYMVNVKSMPPALAVDYAQREVTRMGRIALKNLSKAIECFFDYSPDKAESVRAREESVNILNHTIADAISELKAFELSSATTRRVSQMTIVVTDLERLSDHAVNMVEYAESMIKKKAVLSEEANMELRKMATDTLREVELSLNVFETENYSYLDEIEKLEQSVDMQENNLVNNHVERLMNSSCNPVAGVVFCDIVTDLERCADHGINIAYALKEKASEERKHMSVIPHFTDKH